MNAKENLSVLIERYARESEELDKWKKSNPIRGRAYQDNLSIRSARLKSLSERIRSYGKRGTLTEIKVETTEKTGYIYFIDISEIDAIDLLKSFDFAWTHISTRNIELGRVYNNPIS